MDSQRELTFGEKAVGLSFNPGGKEEVNQIKIAAAVLVDVLDHQRTKAKGDGSAVTNGEVIAQYTLAIRSIQEGQMWGVKAATWQY